MDLEARGARVGTFDRPKHKRVWAADTRMSHCGVAACPTRLPEYQDDGTPFVEDWLAAKDRDPDGHDPYPQPVEDQIDWIILCFGCEFSPLYQVHLEAAFPSPIDIVGEHSDTGPYQILTPQHFKPRWTRHMSRKRIVKGGDADYVEYLYAEVRGFSNFASPLVAEAKELGDDAVADFTNQNFRWEVIAQRCR